mgnify:CR=1 FL=1
MEIPTPPSWRAILKRIIRPAGERQRLAKILDLSTMTLTRWISGESIPHKVHILRLLHVVNPALREELLDALEADFPDIRQSFKSEGIEHLSSAFFAELLNIRATTPVPLLFYLTGKTVLEKAITLLDPDRMGMAITLARCMPPVPEQHNKILSLKEVAGRGTPPWKADLEPESIFLGAESLAGYAMQKGHAMIVADLKAETMRQTRRTEHEVSSAVYPIMLSGRVAGCLIASSTQPGYFTSEYTELLEIFSHLASLAFEQDEFYPLSMISLQILPSQEVQLPIIGKFWRRSMEIQEESLQRGESISNAEAEKLALQEIEAELLARAAKKVRI